MPLSLPNLDDRTYDDLVAEAVAMLPRLAPAWTDRNPSDPGITLVELLAYFTEHLIYRLNRISRESKIRFLRLLSGADGDANGRWDRRSTEQIDEALERVVRALRRPERAVTAADYEYLATQGAPHIVRARPFARRNLEQPDDAGRERDAPGHMSLVVVPAGDLASDAVGLLVSQVRDYLEPRRLLATRLDRKSTRLNSSHLGISYAVFCLKKKKK